ncbi:hypothetical protein E2C01_026798 [Portunus trituberculatus]|uniref:Uncharacterized protein n=1 Tax=Portunus trituberculatus TaxID=210409 RepID=A0A5B7EJB7_PORTR|nr:hypothetical protein [Portunus trituberculatus]
MQGRSVRCDTNRQRLSEWIRRRGEAGPYSMSLMLLLFLGSRCIFGLILGWQGRLVKGAHLSLTESSLLIAGVGAMSKRPATLHMPTTT